MNCSHETHLHERDYIQRVDTYLSSTYGTSIEELALSLSDIAMGLHDNLHPSEYVDRNAKEWGIHRKQSSIPGTAPRIVYV